MNYKIENTLRRNKKTFIFAGILWLFLTIVFIMPLARAWDLSTLENGKLSVDAFSKAFSDSFTNPMENIVKLGAYWDSFISFLWKYTLIFLGIILIGLIRTAPKNEYTDIEHGSSDWCEHGEQYKVLSPKKGIILGEKNYLPVDKRGNVNVLVVGRIRCW